MRVTRTLLLSALVLSTLTTGSPPAAAGEYGELNPAAPPETAQYGFLIGEWQCTIRAMQPDRSFKEGSATWTGRYILDGWAIQDHWISDQPDGSKAHGTNIRSFNPETKEWDNRWLSMGNLQWKYYSSVQQGDTMVMTGGEGSSPNGDFVDRNTFYDITADGWKWRKDRSFDGGESWFEGVAHITATRERPALLERVRHGTVDSGGVKLHYAELGEGPLLVLLHGFPDYWYTWRDQMEALAADYRVVALDLRGYNKSDAPEGVDAYAMARLIGDVAATVGHFGEKRAIVAGHDWGGAIAWQVALWRPDLVERLIVLSTPHPNGLFRELRDNEKQKAGSDYARRFQQEGAHESLTAEGLLFWLTDEDARPHYLAALERSNFEGMLNYYKANYPRTDGDAGAADKSGAPAGPRFTQRIGCPVLVIHGLDDPALLPAGFNGTWEWLDGELTQVALPGVGHFVQQDASQQVTDAMIAWLARTGG